MKPISWICFVFSLFSCTQGSCHIYGKPTQDKYSTKTPYQYIVDNLKTDIITEDSTCENIQYWSIIRHGTRYPSKKAINIINNVSNSLKQRIVTSENTKLCSKDLDLFKNWNADIPLEEAKNLHREGIEELIFMGERLYSRYPDLFSDYHPEDFVFRSTNEQRTILSFESLALGLFSRPIANKVELEEPIKPHDPLIRFYKLCDKWIKSVKKNDSAKSEYFQFVNSQYVHRVRENISSLLGFSEPLSYAELESLYLTCNFDQAWTPKSPSPWCGLFTVASLEVMEYIEDLEYYWVDGPGYEITRKPACLLISDVYHNFLNATKGGREEKGIFYFTHSGTILKFLAFLETHTDTDHLRRDNFSTMKNRKWKTSKIGPFSANISFLLQKCDLGYLVCLYVNEQLTSLPGCDNDGCCPWDKFVALVLPKVEACDFTEFCRVLQHGEKEEEITSVPDDRY